MKEKGKKFGFRVLPGFSLLVFSTFSATVNALTLLGTVPATRPVNTCKEFSFRIGDKVKLTLRMMLV